MAEHAVADALPNVPSEPLQWQVHLARSQPTRLVWLLAIIAVVSLVAGLVVRSPWGIPAAAALLLGATADFLFPVTYRLSDGGIAVHGLLLHSQLTWKQVRRATLAEEAVKLSPSATPSRLDAYRGVYLRFAGNRDQVLEVLRAHGVDC